MQLVAIDSRIVGTSHTASQEEQGVRKLHKGEAPHVAQVDDVRRDADHR